jgi:hypothetical protein
MGVAGVGNELRREEIRRVDERRDKLRRTESR